MKLRVAIRRLTKLICSILLALLLLGAGVVVALYSPWLQRMLTQTLNRVEIGTLAVRMQRLRITPPLNVKADSLQVIISGDTLLTASRLDARLRPLALIGGRLALDPASLYDARVNLGGPDSSMYLRIAADTLALRPASLALPGMNIDIDGGAIKGASIAMTLNPTPPSPSDSSSTTDMRIRIKHLDLERFAYNMRMLPTIDSLGAYIARGTLAGGDIDLRNQAITLGSFTGSGLDVCYMAPDAATVAATPVFPADTTKESEPWTIRIDTIGFDRSQALYTTRGVVPQPGLDFAYIQADSMTLGIKNFYNRQTDVAIPLNFSARERCGVDLRARGTVRTSATDLRLDSFTVEFPDYGNILRFNMLMGMGDLMSDPALPIALQADGSVAVGDLARMFPAAGPMVKGMRPDSPVDVDVNVYGTMGDLSVDRLSVRLGRIVTLSARGRVANALDLQNIDGHLSLTGDIINGRILYQALAGAATGSPVTIPPMYLTGAVDMHRGLIKGDLKAKTLGGHLGLDASWNSRHDDYDLSLATDAFPVEAFLPEAGVGPVTASVTANGHGFNFADTLTRATAHIDLKEATFRGARYSDITADATLDRGHASLKFESAMPDADFALEAEGNLIGDTYSWTASLDGEHIDLYSLKLTETPCTLQTSIDATARIKPEPSLLSDISARVTLHSLDYTGQAGMFSIDGVTARLDADTAVTNLSVNNRDFYTFFSSECGLDSLLAGFSRASDLLDEQIRERNIRVDTLRKALPQFVLDVNAGADNALTDILASRNMSFGRFTAEASNDSLLSLDARVLRFRTGSTRLDTITFHANQRRDNLVFRGAIGNRPGTLDDWARVDMMGFLRTDHVGLRLTQHNIQGREGYDIGLRAALADSTVTLNFVPYTPTIGYKQWTVNSDNFISYQLSTEHVDANLHMEGNNSALAIYTEHDPASQTQEDLIIRLTDIHLQDWMAINPFAPPMSGDVGADLRLSRQDNSLLGNGSLSIADFNYDRRRVGTFRADLDVEAAAGGRLKASADLFVDSVKTMTLAGAINPPASATDSTAVDPVKLDLTLIHFPLAVANPFLPAGTAQLSGMLNGSMSVTGRTDSPRLNGWMQFDSTAVRLALTGTDYPFSPVRIPVESNVVHFNDFAINGVNGNPLTVNGTVDLRNLTRPQIDLALKANNMQLVNTNRARRGADVYGKAFVDLDAKAHGNLRAMMVDANLSLLSGTNVTYVMPDAVNAITQHSTGDMVKFVNLADSSAVAEADTVANNSMLMFVNALLTIQPGSTVSVDLSSDGKNKVQLQPTGTVNYTLSPVTADGRLSGRINIEKGFARYTMPPLSEKLFNFNADSYVAFNGDIMNPTLNIHAYDDVKANVTQQGQNSRLVDFDVKLAVTGTLDNMKIDFDLAAENDITVANELQSMSADQRANQAMNLLLYNVYTGPNTTGNAAIGGNMLYSFLESQLNSWAANTLHGVDLSFGINQYDRTQDGQTSLTTTYSYQVSKSLFDDRFKIVVGGNYSTDANADENFSQNLINDISFEYYINKQHTMYVRLFRHTGYESILEGEVTQTGVGFVYKRRLRRLWDLFIPQGRIDRQERAKAASDAAATENEPPKTSEQ